MWLESFWPTTLQKAPRGVVALEGTELVGLARDETEQLLDLDLL
jgi:hypothetical protein